MLPCFKNLPEVKEIVESFVGSGIVVTQVKVSLQKSGLADQLLKIKDHYECLVKLIDKLESAKYTIKKAGQSIQELDFGKDTCNIKQYIKKNAKHRHSSYSIKQRLRITSFKILNPHVLL